MQTKENTATDPLQTHTSRKSTGNTQHTIKANKQRLTVTHAPKQTHLNIQIADKIQNISTKKENTHNIWH